jgi:hypothetical protein
VVSWVASLTVAEILVVLVCVVVDVLGHLGRGHGEEVGARIAVPVQAQVVLVVEGLGQAQRDAAQRVLGQVQRFAAELQHAAQGAAGQRALRQRRDLVAVT